MKRKDPGYPAPGKYKLPSDVSFYRADSLFGSLENNLENLITSHIDKKNLSRAILSQMSLKLKKAKFHRLRAMQERLALAWPRFLRPELAVTDFPSLCRTSRGLAHLTSGSAALATQVLALTLPEAALERITATQEVNRTAPGKPSVEDWKTVQRTTQALART